MKKEEILNSVWNEVERAMSLFPAFHSGHEGIAVILEEFEELKAETFKKNPDKDKLAEEAIQLSAMAIRFLMDVVENG